MCRVSGNAINTLGCASDLRTSYCIATASRCRHLLRPPTVTGIYGLPFTQSLETYNADHGSRRLNPLSSWMLFVRLDSSRANNGRFLQTNEPVKPSPEDHDGRAASNPSA